MPQCQRTDAFAEDLLVSQSIVRWIVAESAVLYPLMAVMLDESRWGSSARSSPIGVGAVLMSDSGGAVMAD